MNASHFIHSKEKNIRKTQYFFDVSKVLMYLTIGLINITFEEALKMKKNIAVLVFHLGFDGQWTIREKQA